MQIEDKQQDQATPEAGTAPVEHFHTRLFTDGETTQDIVVGQSMTRLVQLLHRTLKLSWETAAEELNELALAGAPDGEIGRAYLRVREVDRLKGMFDPELFEHPLFEDGAGYRRLLRAAFLALLDDGMKSVPVTEEHTMSAVACRLPKEECPPFAEWLAKADKHACPGCGTEHGKGVGKAVVVPVHPDGKPVNLADILASAREGLEEMFAAAGIEVEIETLLPEDNVAD